MIILASASPRRKELLEQIGCTFNCETSNAEEVKTGIPQEVVMANALIKAKDIAAKHKDTLVIGADTVVALDDAVYGKPKDTEDAFSMLKTLSGKRHFVYTGLALVYNDKVWQDFAVTQVDMADMSDVEIKAYIKTGEPMDKAGSYAVQGKIAIFIKALSGSYSNVVGLPLHKLYQLAQKAGFSLLNI
ncbi:Maf family protein [Pectinatus brassicae]|uniref:dTTP/UTP pyrophosphatase n=1 Tax=Pectinatus brassicae TaxID=862415 RepID=A0A840UKC1_9FIRM|nr:Maf family protein [Pectinatus brassicae]MBB5337459.1 septum formation protein [Pectinatus brassicae]